MLNLLKKYQINIAFNRIYFFSKPASRFIVAYYKNIVLSLFKSNVIYNKFFPKLVSTIKSDDYNQFLTHLAYLENESKKNKNYNNHITLLKNYRKIDTENVISLSKGLSKIKAGVNFNEIGDIWKAIDNSKFALLIYGFIALILVLVLNKIGFFKYFGTDLGDIIKIIRG
jgi:hypothetical protein